MSGERKFLEAIRERTLLGDGATGTELFRRGAVRGQCLEQLNLTRPDMVLALHGDYIAAGSMVIETNTFGANRLSLQRYGLEEDLARIAAAGAALARHAAGKDVFVAGSIGPVPHPEGEPVSAELCRSILVEQALHLADGGVDLLLFESFTDLNDLLLGIRAARESIALPIVAQMAYSAEGRLADGTTADEVLRACLEAGADIVGANCGYGIPSVKAALAMMAPFGRPLSAYLNASFPEQIDGSLAYRAEPRYLAARACELLADGVVLLGGCCGTGPDTIKAIASVLPQASGSIPVSRAMPPASSVIKIDERQLPDASLPLPGGFASALAAAPFPVLVELDPPTDLDMSFVTESAHLLRDAGVTAITVADNPMASACADVISVAGILQRETGLPVLPHLCGRDRNRLALQSTIMGAHLQGISALLCVTGDPVRMCNDPDTSGVFDLNSVSLVRLVNEFNCGRRHIQGSGTNFAIGVALNPNVKSLKGQIDKLGRKLEAGADFALTQPIFEEERLDLLQQAMVEAGISCPVYIGLMPLVSSRNAEFLHNEVPGILIPQSIRERMTAFDTPADQRAAALEMMLAFADRIAPRINGLYAITPRRHVELVLPLIQVAVAAG